MKFIYAVIALSAIVSSVSATPTLLKKLMKRDVNPNLIPQFGVSPGVNPSGTGDCDGVQGPNGKAIKIPCSCPPDRNQFIADLNANVAAGHCTNNPAVAVPAFPEDDSSASQLTRLHIATVTLQNLRGPGQGCPQASTTFGAQAQAVQAGANSPPPAASPPAPAPPAPAPPAPAPPAPPAPAPLEPRDTCDQ